MNIEFPNLRHLRAFLEVGRLNGISAAAEVVFMSQPAVTQAVTGLEHLLDEVLFERSPDGVFLTDAGELFHARISTLFNFLKNGAASAARLSKRGSDKPHPDFQMRVTSAQLRALIAVQEAGNFSMAAQLIGVAQPSLHRAARDLEKTAGISFFAAWRKGIALTESGEQFAKAVRLAWAEIGQGYAELSALRGGDVSQLTIGSMPLSRSAILPDAINALLDENSGIQIKNVDGPYGELLRGLRYGDIDILIGALRDPLPAEDVEQEVLFDDPLALVVGPDHPLAARTDIRIDDILSYPWIAPPITTPAGRYLYKLLEIDKLEKSPVRVVSSSMVLIRGLMMRSHYVTIMSRSQIRLETELRLMVPLNVELPNAERPIGLTTRRAWKPTPAQARFVELVRQSAIASIEKTNSKLGH